MDHPVSDSLAFQTRRHFFKTSGLGLGSAALSSLLTRDAIAAGEIPPAFRAVAPKAKRAIYLFMSGAPSQQDLFDHKPKMAEWFDKDLPDSIRNGQRITTMTSGQKRFPIAPTKYAFETVDNNDGGATISELLPYTRKMAKDLCIIKSMHTEAINHDPAITYICTGNQLPGRPSLGSWLSYGLGSLNDNLPSFVVLNATWSAKRDAQAIYSRLWGSGPLPSKHQGVLLRSAGDPVLFLNNPDGIDPATRRRMLDTLNQINAKNFEHFGDPEIQARIAQYEMAYRMQTSVPELADLSKEPESTFEAYGPASKQPGTFAYCALMARRLAEKGVRFTQVFHRGWDQHFNISRDLPLQCGDVDQASYALVQDLKQRGMLDDTLVIWGGEFGRTIYCQGKLTKDDYGRDHHPRCFTIWMAGGGVKPGIVYGETDDFSYNVTENPVHIHELNATLLHLMGLDHQRLAIKHQGLDLRLTGVEPVKPVKDILL
ncbi:sulfatase [Haloferula helveola]|uniref:Sulfatase n=1 Tax=Haloferula helveola TaxID=490095 RepID=A0ABN6GXZ4_9BACT|nr:sulfatase [Haloferula helveola]